MLTVVIPVYNHIDDTIVTLDTLEATTRCSVIIVDDGSTDGTREALENRDVTYIANETNLGVNASWNVGIRAAIAAGADYICVANNDLAFAPGWWRPLREALDDGYAVVSPYSTEGQLPEDWPAGSRRHENPHRLDILGSCFAFKPSLITEIGYVPEVMRHYYGDNWICDTCARKRLKVRHIREGYVHHFYMQTTSTVGHESLERDAKAYARYQRAGL